MKEETYKLNDAGTHIVQQPEMKEPVILNADAYYDDGVLDAEVKKIKKYKEHIASLKTYPISGIVPDEWKVKELKEKRDWKKVVVCEHGQRCGCTNSEAERCLYSKFVAVPIQQPKEESQQELWKYVHERILQFQNSNTEGTKHLYSDLEQHFSIQRLNINKNDIE